MSSTIKGNILTPGGWIHGAIAFGERVDSITGESIHPSGNSDDYILPGFIDLHVHGGAGKDIMEGGEAVYTIAAIHARHGTTSLLATTMTAPPEDIDMALTAIGIAANHRRPNTARVLGAHLEGPYINSGKLGRSRTMRAPPTWPKSNACKPWPSCASSPSRRKSPATWTWCAPWPMPACACRSATRSVPMKTAWPRWNTAPWVSRICSTP